MQDKNGIEMKTGDIVEITGAYFKNDNGLYFIDCSPGDPNWCGSDYSLKRISKSGKSVRQRKIFASGLLVYLLTTDPNAPRA